MEEKPKEEIKQEEKPAEQQEEPETTETHELKFEKDSAPLEVTTQEEKPKPADKPVVLPPSRTPKQDGWFDAFDLEGED